MTRMSWSLSHCVFCGLPLSSPEIWGKPFDFLKSQFSCLQSGDSPEHLCNLSSLFGSSEEQGCMASKSECNDQIITSE